MNSETKKEEKARNAANVEKKKEFNDERPSRIYFNPPPQDKRCECCRRHIDELKPFGGPGDPLVGDFTGCLLIKEYRYDFPEYKLPSKYIKYLKKDGKIDKQMFIEKFGKKEYDEVLFGLMGMYDIISAYWLCRDCILISGRNEFIQKRFQYRQ